MVGIAGIVIGLIQNGVSMWVSYVDEPKTTVVERNYDPYEFEAETLAATGESYQTELRQGTYQVGVHIPEGVYTVNLLEGYGIIDVEDDKNGIYFGRTFGDDEKYDEVHTLEDVRLHQGAVLKVGDSVKLELISENAQPQKMVSFDNPLLEGNTAERIALKKGRFYVAGKDFPAGVYDVSTDKDWGIFKYRIPTENEYVEDGFYDYSEILDVDELGKIYLNIILPEGTEVSTEETDMYLTPSWIIGSEDYRSYYPE